MHDKSIFRCHKYLLIYLDVSYLVYLTHIKSQLQKIRESTKSKLQKLHIMTRYSIALTTLLSTTLLTTPVVADPWSYLSVGIPIALSDMAVTVMTYTAAKDGNATSTATTNGDAAAANGGEVTKKIMLTGGCVSEKGNEFLGEYFACLELTNKVRF
jgi:hypothetical protein